MTKSYEINSYEYGIDAEGNHTHIDNVDNPVKTGWTVYVREYPTADVEEQDEWEEVYDRDFNTEEERDAAVADLLVKYPDATEDFY